MLRAYIPTVAFQVQMEADRRKIRPGLTGFVCCQCCRSEKKTEALGDAVWLSRVTKPQAEPLALIESLSTRVAVPRNHL